MTFWCITGIDSDKWVDNTRDNFKRASVGLDARLVIVENGPGLGQWGKLQNNEYLITSNPGCANYINAGLSFVKKHCKPDDWFLKFDSDDYYGNGFMNQHLYLSNNGAKALSSSSIFVRTELDDLWFVDFDVMQGEKLINKVLHGPTLAARMDVVVDFPEPPEPWGEDALWIDKMLNNGIEFVSLSLYAFAYCRHSDRDHSFPIMGDLLRHMYSGAKVYNLGKWNEQIVNGQAQHNYGTEIPFDPYSMVKAGEQLLDIKMRIKRH